MTVREVPVRVWLTTDATLDNIAAVERVGGDVEVANRAEQLRHLGWQAAAVHPQRGQGHFSWPPDDDVLAIEVRPVDVAFIREVLKRTRLVVISMLENLALSVPARQEQEESLRLGDEAIRYWGS
jgi:hypothetical protein